MGRLSRFAANAGASGCARTAIVAVIVVSAIRHDIAEGHWLFTLPLLGVTIAGAYSIRDHLVNHLGVVRILMNSIAIAGIIAFVLLREQVKPEPLWFRMAIIALVGSYMGCYFFLMSDERIGVD